MFEVKPRMRLSEGSYNTKSSLKMGIWFQRGFVGGGWFGCLMSNLGCDFLRALITKKYFEIVYMVSKRFRGDGWFGCVRSNLACDFQRARITKKVV